MMTLVNRITGKEATQAEIEACEVRAIEILQSPYSSPEQVLWAMGFVGDPVQYMLNPRQQQRMDKA